MKNTYGGVLLLVKLQVKSQIAKNITYAANAPLAHGENAVKYVTFRGNIRMKKLLMLVYFTSSEYESKVLLPLVTWK